MNKEAQYFSISSILKEWIPWIYKKVKNINSNFPLKRYSKQPDKSEDVFIRQLLKKYSGSSEIEDNITPEYTNLPILFIFPRRSQADLSIDPDSAKAQVILCLKGYSHILIETINEDMSPTGRLPFLATLDGEVLSMNDIETRILFNRDTENESSNNEDNLKYYESVGFTYLLDTYIKPALLFEEWYNEDIYSTYILSIYKSYNHFPISFITAKRQRQNMKDYLDKKTTYPYNSASELLDNAQKAVKALTIKLKISKYITGESISAADVVAFAYIYILNTYFFSVQYNPLNTIIANNEIIEEYFSLMYEIYNREASKYVYSLKTSSVNSQRKVNISLKPQYQQLLISNTES